MIIPVKLVSASVSALNVISRAQLSILDTLSLPSVKQNGMRAAKMKMIQIVTMMILMIMTMEIPMIMTMEMKIKIRMRLRMRMMMIVEKEYSRIVKNTSTV